MIECFQNSSISDFLSQNEEHLLKNESINNLVLGLAYSISNKKLETENAFYYTITKNNEVSGQAVRTHNDKPLTISGMDLAEIEALAKVLKDKNVHIECVVGPKSSSSAFSKIWSQLNSIETELEMHLGVYELTEVIAPHYAGGKMIKASLKHENIALAYIDGFLSDCFPNHKNSDDRVKKMFEQQVQNGSLFLWENSLGEVVSMAAVNRETKNAATISLVYTPISHRGKGYASCMVAKLSEKILNDGKEKCNLFTDMSNPTSNSIYQKIGYKFIGESLHYNFKKV